MRRYLSSSNQRYPALVKGENDQPEVSVVVVEGSVVELEPTVVDDDVVESGSVVSVVDDDDVVADAVVELDSSVGAVVVVVAGSAVVSTGSTSATVVGVVAGFVRAGLSVLGEVAGAAGSVSVFEVWP